MAHFTHVKNGYTAIIESLTQARNQLITKLNNCYITGINNYTILELIEAMSRIETQEYYNDNNIKPTNIPPINIQSDLTQFNEDLYKRISYYRELIAYYLVDKGVPTEKVNGRKTLIELIALIDEIVLKLPTTMTIEQPNTSYYYGENIVLEYELISQGNIAVTDGEITIEKDGVLYDSIIASQPLELPQIMSTKTNNQYQPITYTITYKGSNEYQSYPPIQVQVIVLPPRINLSIQAINKNNQGRYYLNNHKGYQDDNWDIKINSLTATQPHRVIPNAPFEIYIDNVLIGEYSTGASGYTLQHNFNDVGTHTIRINTTYEDPDNITDVEAEYEIEICYNQLYQSTNNYVNYVGQEQYEYEIIIRDEDSGQEYDTSLDGREITLLLNNNQIDTITIIQGKATANIPLLGQGEHTLTWIMNDNKINTYINILSNFIIPSKNTFFLSDTPDIIYAPLNTENYGNNNWIPVQNKKITGTITDSSNTPIGIEWFTNSQGILHKLKEYTTPSTYTLDITSASDSLTEHLQYTYTINTPFTVERTQYNKKIGATYQIKIYDKEHYITNDYSFITFNNNIKNICTFVETEYSTYYEVTVTIPSNANTYGDHTMTVSINGYTQSYNFTLLEKIFTLLTQSVVIGTEDIQIECMDDNVNNITISGNNIVVNSITKQNNIFICNITFNRAGNIPLSVNDNNSSEQLAINVLKRNLNPIVSLKNTQTNTQITQFYYEDKNHINYHIDFNETLIQSVLCNITIRYNNTDTIYNTNISPNNVREYEDILPSAPLNSGQFTIILSAAASTAYYGFTTSQTFTILKSLPNYEITSQTSGYINKPSIIIITIINWNQNRQPFEKKLFDFKSSPIIYYDDIEITTDIINHCIHLEIPAELSLENLAMINLYEYEMYTPYELLFLDSLNGTDIDGVITANYDDLRKTIIGL